MKIKTTPFFKVRRLAEHTGDYLPEIKKNGKSFALKKLIFLNEEKMEREIFNSCIILKNLAIVHENMPMSADFLIEELMDNSRMLKPIYADILSAYRNGKEEDAFDILYENIPIKESKNFSMILSKIDQINPAELITYMTNFEESFAAKRMTKGIKRAEQKSIITTMMATASIFTILLNFAIVVVFMDTLSMLGQFF